MKSTFTIFILFIACTSMLHGMRRNENFNWNIDKNNPEKLNDQLKAIGKRGSKDERNKIKYRLAFLEVRNFHADIINRQIISLQNLSDTDIEKYKILHKNLAGFLNLSDNTVIDDTEKETIPYMLQDFEAIANTCELFKKLLSGKLNPKKISKYLPVKDNDPDRFKKLNNFCPWLIVDAEGNNAFLRSLGNLSLRVIKKILNHYPDLILSKNRDGETALHIATRKNKILLVKFLTNTNKIYKIDIDEQEKHFEKTALHISCSNLNVKIARILLRCGAQIKFDNNEQNAIEVLFDLPFTEKSIEIIRMIFTKHPNEKVENSKETFAQFILEHIQSAPKDMSTEKLLGDIKNLLEQKRKEQQLKEDNEENERLKEEEIILLKKSLLLHNTKNLLTDIDQLNIEGETPLFFAATNDKSRVFDLLLKHGADPNAVSNKIVEESFEDILKNNNSSGAEYVKKNNNGGLMGALVAKVYDRFFVNKDKYDITPLVGIISSKSFDDNKVLQYLKILSNHKADINKDKSLCNGDSLNPLFGMVREKYIKSIKFLLENFQVSENNKKIAIGIANQFDYTSIVQLLSEDGESKL